MPSHLTVVAEMTAKPGKESDLRATLLALVEPTRAEAGCVDYFLHESTDQPGRFVFYENWKSREALDRHLETPYLKDLGARSGELLEEPARIVTYTRIV